MLGRPVGLVEQEFGRRASELVLGLADRRERHGRVRGELDVAVADDREISRDAHARLAQPAQQAQREHVVDAEHRGRLVLRAAEQAVGGGGTGPGIHRRDRHLGENLARVQPGVLDRPVGAPAGDEDAAYPLFLEHAQVPALLVVRLVRVAQDHRVARRLGVVFDAAGHLGEERVRHVQHDQPQAAAPPRAELARGAVRDEPELLHRGLDPGTGQRPDQVGVGRKWGGTDGWGGWGGPAGWARRAGAQVDDVGLADRSVRLTRRPVR